MLKKEKTLTYLQWVVSVVVGAVRGSLLWIYQQEIVVGEIFVEVVWYFFE